MAHVACGRHTLGALTRDAARPPTRTHSWCDDAVARLTGAGAQRQGRALGAGAATRQLSRLLQVVAATATHTLAIAYGVPSDAAGGSAAGPAAVGASAVSGGTATPGSGGPPPTADALDALVARTLGPMAVAAVADDADAPAAAASTDAHTGAANRLAPPLALSLLRETVAAVCADQAAAPPGSEQGLSPIHHASLWATLAGRRGVTDAGYGGSGGSGGSGDSAGAVGFSALARRAAEVSGRLRAGSARAGTARVTPRRMHRAREAARALL